MNKFICLTCKKEYKPSSHPEKSKYCSRKCKDKAHTNNRTIHCLYCQKKTRHTRKFCTLSCAYKYNHRNNKYEKLENGLVKWEDSVLTLKNYKEPLRRIEKGKGFGWYGTIACDIKGDGIQCHICGEIKESLIGHIYRKHGLKANEYREQFGLSNSTALVSEDVRMGLKKRTLKWLKTLTPEQKKELKMNLNIARLKRRHFYPKKSLEQKNKEGTCPDQLLQKIKDVKEKIGHTPSITEFITETKSQRYKHLIFKTFGSWKKAIHLIHAELSNRKSSKKKCARYEREDLLEMLRLYAQENRQIPTYTDSKRGLIPPINAYQRVFGSIENARRQAGVYEFIDEDVLQKFRIKSH